MYPLVSAESLAQSPGALWPWASAASRVVAAGYGDALYTIGMRPVCFLSDFGLADDFTGTCKGVMLRIAPDVSIVDLTHEVPGFEVETGLHRQCLRAEDRRHGPQEGAGPAG